MTSTRKLTDYESLFLKRIIEFAPEELQQKLRTQLSTAYVTDMRDGGMGSLRFSAGDTAHRKFGRSISSVEFTDPDGVPVIADIYLDKDDTLFELDMWKVDFSPLQSYPTEFTSLRRPEERIAD